MKRFLIALAATLAASLCGAPAQAQHYPSKPVRVLVGFPPGGSSDILIRVIAQELTKNTGQSFIVENRAGANSLIATQDLIKAAPDGYTLIMTHTSAVTNPLFYSRKTYDPTKDFTPVATIARSPFVLLAHPSLGVKNMAELIALAKSKPGQINYGSPGIGSMQQLTQELLLARTGTKMMHVPYKGGGPALTDLLAGHIPLLFSTTVQALPFIKQGQVIPLAVTSPKRLDVLPDVPTIAETVPGFDSDLWHAIVAPPGTPAAVVETLRTQIANIVNSPMMQQTLREQGAIPYLTTPEEFKALISSEYAKWNEVVRSAGLRDTM